jgi:acyl carrier protein
MSQPPIDEILDVVAQKALIDRSRLTPEAKLADLNVSSLDMVEVVFALEDKFGIELPFNANTSAGEFQTVGDVIAAVEKQLAAKN